MRRIHIIYLTIFFYILLAALCPVFAKLYVDRKDAREYAEAYDRFKKVFADQDKYVFIDYSGEKVSFEKASLPKNIIEDYTQNIKYVSTMNINILDDIYYESNEINNEEAEYNHNIYKMDLDGKILDKID